VVLAAKRCLGSSAVVPVEDVEEQVSKACRACIMASRLVKILVRLLASYYAYASES